MSCCLICIGDPPLTEKRRNALIVTSLGTLQEIAEASRSLGLTLLGKDQDLDLVTEETAEEESLVTTAEKEIHQDPIQEKMARGKESGKSPSPKKRTHGRPRAPRRRMS